MTDYAELKAALLAACAEYVQGRIATAEQAIASARDAATDDTKSSAGDKFETTREMMQQEIARNEQLLAEARRMEQVLMAGFPASRKEEVRPGSLIETDRGIFFICISIGLLRLRGADCYVISADSPLGRQLLGKRAGDRLTFNGRSYQINALS
jgi:transcription elongation GreA/GreB family factor